MSDFRVAPARPKKLAPETHNHFWHPNRVGVRMAPDSFMKQIKDLNIEPEIAITWNPIRERWQVWQKSPRVNHPVVQGWKLLFWVCDWDTGAYWPLDERVMWKLWDRAAMNPANRGSLWGYWQRIEAEMERDEEKKNSDRDFNRKAETDPYYDYSQIKVSGCGKSRGDKFATYMS